MRSIIPLLILVLTGSLCYSQETRPGNAEILQEPLPLSKAEMESLKTLPMLTLPEKYRLKSLPAVVDNSTQPYMREVFQQAGYCCGQAAAIAYNYTYEIDCARNVPANNNNNLYPTHFTWNWMHGGNGWYGVSYLHSLEILRHCGNVNVADYGGTLDFGGYARWMSGYADYKKGMENRINSVYQIHVDTPEGLETFKHWINDHIGNSSTGGVGSFYSQFMVVSNTLPPGTPEEGKYVLTSFGGSPNHAQTIVGYNDSIRWDYNGDGQYTNDIDINNDGVVNMKDREIGGFKMVQSYGGVPNWGDQGYAYMMYKTVADDLGQGGIWNHSVHVLKVKEECHPQATMKVTLTHDKRNMIKVVAGLSNNPASTSPHYILEYPIFNFQGGPQFMQGGWSDPANKTIEFGLDISPLLSLVSLDQDVKFFLQVYEYDTSGTGSGTINEFSVFDYTDGTTQYSSYQTNVPINNNDLTSVSLIANFDFDRVAIISNNLPPAEVGQPYACQLTATGGETPYSFSLVHNYTESQSLENFPGIAAEQLSPSNNSSGFVTKTLDFAFPFYDSTYNSVTAHVDGYLMFDEQLYPYPYFIDDMVMFRITRHISPFMCHAMRLYSTENDGIWYEGDSTSATFRWKASIDGFNGSSEINFAVTLYPSGDIAFFYGNIDIGDHILWIPGLCDGNENDLQLASFYPDDLPAPDSKFTFERFNYPEGISVSEDGLVSGIVQQPVNALPMTFKVTDNNFVYSTKTLTFSTMGISVTDSIISGDDDVIEYGETAYQSVTLTNLESGDVSDASITININNPYVTILDNYEYIGTIAAGQSVTLENAFSFSISSDIPDEHLIEIETSVEGLRQIWENTLIHYAHAPVAIITGLIVDDGNNGIPDPGESFDLVLQLQNQGSSTASSLNCVLETSDPFVTINNATSYIGALPPDTTRPLNYNISIDEDAPIGHIISMEVLIQGDMGYLDTLNVELPVGLVTEDFETGDFSLFTWGFKGNRHWDIDFTYPFEGSYCASSGNITHKQSSSMILDIDVLYPGDVSFWRMVSCENSPNDNYDFLSFLVDGLEIARWDSILPWELASFPLEEGYHRLEWRYSKDSTISYGLDGACIDLISLPGCIDLSPHISPDPLFVEKGMHPETTDTDTLVLFNFGQGEIEYEFVITGISDNKDDPESIAGSFLECEQTEFYSGNYFEWDFTLYNGSDDNEWIQQLDLLAPLGIIVETATNFSGGLGGDLQFQGSFGNGPSMSWYGEDPSGWGVVHGGEFAFGKITGMIDPGFSGNAVLDYVITGDIYGSEPHILEGQIELTNLGEQVTWLTCNPVSGVVWGEGEVMIMLNFNTEGLEDGDYYCNIFLRDNFQHETLIPVHLLVDTGLQIQEEADSYSSLQIYPNPFSNKIAIDFELPADNSVEISLIDLYGRTVETILEAVSLKAGRHVIEWESDHNNLPSGIYFIVLENNVERKIQKVVRQ